MRVSKQWRARAVTGLFIVFGVMAAAITPLLRSPNVKADAINNTDFVFTVDTTKPGSANTQFVIPVQGGGYNYSVDCNNDGTLEALGQSASYTCHYTTPGTYTIRIGGVFPWFYLNNTGDKLKMLSIDQWGTNKWRYMGNAFYGAENMDVKATDTPDLSQATGLVGMFQNNTSLKGETANWNWNTVTITNTTGMFYGATQFNQNIGSWNMSNVTNAGGMFRGATQFNNGGSDSIKNWNTGKLEALNSMFENATSFNQPIGSWNVRKASLMLRMLNGATSFNQSLAGWQLDSLVATTGLPTSTWSGAVDALNNTALSIENYDATLIAWNKVALKSPVVLGAAGLKYCLADEARSNIIKPTADGGHGWTIKSDSKECPKHTVTFDSQSGSAVPNQSVAYGDKIPQPPAPTRSGYTLAGWFTDPSFATQWNFSVDTMPNAGMTLYARWNINQYKVHYDANTGSGTMTDTTGNFGATVQIAANGFTKAGYTFTGWNTQANGTGTAYTPGANYIIPAADTTLYAQWEDRIQPSTPAAAPDLRDSDDSGNSNSDNLTNKGNATFTVTCTEVGSTITLYANNTANGTTTCAAVGATTVTVATPLVNGAYAITYTETDASNNESGRAPELHIIVDTVSPTVAQTTALATVDSPELVGTIDDPVATIEVTIDGTTYPAVNEGNGNWKIAAGVVRSLSHGTHQATVRATDAAGNVGTHVVNLVIQTATVTPPAPGAGTPTTSLSPSPTLATHSHKKASGLAETGSNIVLLIAAAVLSLVVGGIILKRSLSRR